VHVELIKNYKLTVIQFRVCFLCIISSCTYFNYVTFVRCKLKISTLSVFVIIDLYAVFRAEFLGIILIRLHSKFCLALVIHELIAIKQKAKCKFLDSAMLFFHIINSKC
jgi:hypothetical protein